MHGQFPPAFDRSDIHISGDVTIEDRAAIGPGVVLQATPGSRLIVRAGVCLGAGAVLHAHQGLLEIQADAIVGARALIVGAGTVGAAACVGAESTTISPNIPPQESVAKGALLGAPIATNPPMPEASPDRNGLGNGSNGSNGHHPEPALEDLWREPEKETETLPRSLDPIGLQKEPSAPQKDRKRASKVRSTDTMPVGSKASNESSEMNSTASKTETGTAESADPSTAKQQKEVIIGGAYVRQLMVTLFPHKNTDLSARD